MLLIAMLHYYKVTLIKGHSKFATVDYLSLEEDHIPHDPQQVLIHTENDII